MQEYDVTVIGAGIGGLTCAALLAKRGLSVAVFEQGKRAGGCCVGFGRRGLLFDAASTLFGGFEIPGGFHHKVFSELGVGLDVERLNIPFQFILADGRRIDFHSCQEDMLAAFCECFRDEADAIRSFFDEIFRIEQVARDLSEGNIIFPPTTIHEYLRAGTAILPYLTKITPFFRPLSRYFDKYDLSSQFRNTIGLSTTLMGQVGADQASSLFAAFLMGFPSRGLYYVPGGASMIPKQLVRGLRKHGGRLFYQKSVSQILIEGKTATGVRLSSGEEAPSKYVVANIPVWNLYSSGLIDERHVDRKLKDRLDRISDYSVPFTLYLIVDTAHGNPFARRHYLIENTCDLPAAGNIADLTFLSLGPKPRKSKRHTTKLSMTASTILGERDCRANKDPTFYTDKILNSLSRHFPGIREKIEYIEKATPTTYARYTRRLNGRIGSLPQTPANFGFGGFPNRTIYTNLFLVGDTTFPGQGTDGATASGFNAANIIR